MNEMMEENGIDLVSIRLVNDRRIGTNLKIYNPGDAVRVVADLIKDMDREFLCLINMKNNGTPINCSIISMGGLNNSLVSVREMMKTSILCNSAGIILLHNHPHGSMEPSREDIRVTNKVQMACELMDIRLLDHIIVEGMGGRIYSMRDRNITEPEQLSYSEDPASLHFDSLYSDEADYVPKTLTNMIDNYFLPPDRSGVTYKDRMSEGYHLMQSIIQDLEQSAEAEPLLSEKLKATAVREGILEAEPVRKQQKKTTGIGKSR